MTYAEFRAWLADARARLKARLGELDAIDPAELAGPDRADYEDERAQIVELLAQTEPDAIQAELEATEPCGPDADAGRAAGVAQTAVNERATAASLPAMERSRPIGTVVRSEDPPPYGAPSLFWIYENWQAGPHKAIIHRATCGSCNDGRGIHPGAGDRNGRWVPGLDSWSKALAVASRLNAEVVRPCKRCRPDLPA